MQKIINLIAAVSPLAWPAFAFFVFYELKSEIKTLIGRLKRGKILGQEIELDEQLEQVKQSLDTAKESVSISVDVEDNRPESILGQRIGDIAKTSPREAFLLVSYDLQMTVDQILLRSGLYTDNRPVSMRQVFSKFPSQWLSSSVLESITQFSQLRNRIVHETRLVSDEDLKRAIDIGLELIRIVKSFPVEENRVRDIISVFSDPACTSELVGVKGLRLNTRDPNLRETIRIFPTTQAWYTPGQLVAVEWNHQNIYEQAYYRDPEDSTIKSAWVQAQEFVGRPLPDML